VTFNTLNYTATGTSYYLVRETSQSGNGWTTDNTVYHVRVTVEDVDGKLVATREVRAGTTGTWAAYNDTNGVTFNNTYQAAPTSTQLKATKSTSGTGAPAAWSFNLALYNSNAAGEQLEQIGTDLAARNGAATVTFNTLDYTATGTSYYMVRETSAGGSGWTADSTVYYVRVTVNDVNGQLVPTREVRTDTTGTWVAYNDENGVTFNNIYQATATSTQLRATKTTSGPGVPAAWSFDLALYNSNEAGEQLTQIGTDQTARNGAATVTFSTISLTAVGTTYYLVRETSAGGNGWTKDSTMYYVRVTAADVDGELVATREIRTSTTDAWATYNDTNGVTFNNTYQAAATSTQLKATKSTSGTGTPDEWSFDLALYNSNEAGDQLTQIGTDQTARNGAATVTFNTLNYTATGTSYYLVRETSQSGNGWTADSTVYYVRVTVNDVNGQLVATREVRSSMTGSWVAYNDTNGVAFNNTYQAAPTSTQLAATKSTSGTGAPDEWSFDLALYNSNEAGDQLTQIGADQTARNGAATVTFNTLNYSATGTSYYLVRETSTDGNGWTADSTVYYVRVTVEDVDGELVATREVRTSTTDTWIAYNDTNGVAFTNTYKQGTASAKLEGDKAVPEGSPSRTFTFDAVQVTAKNGTTAMQDGMTDTDTTTGTGAFEFSFTDLAPGEYYFRINERIPTGDLQGWTYDDHSFWATIIVTDNGDGTASADVTYDNGSTTFSNTYDANGSIKLAGTKTVEGKSLAGTAFTFAVTDEDDKEVATGANNGTGTITYTSIDYKLADKDKVFKYTITEDETSGGWTAETGPVVIYVKVTDPGTGTLEVAAYSDQACTIPVTAADMTFKNIYGATGSITLAGTKTANVSLTGKNFTFDVVDEDGEPVMTGSNNGTETITFGTIDYKLSDLGGATSKVFEYTITEGGLGDGWSVAVGEVSIYVMVTDDGNGTLITAAFTDEDCTTRLAAAGVAFANTYNATGDFTLTGTKTANVSLEDKVFTFAVVDGNNNPVMTGENDDTGAITFDKITYTLADMDGSTEKIFKYTITEGGLGDGWTTSVGSTNEIDIYVKVTDNGRGTLTTAAFTDSECTIPLAAAGVSFANTYSAEGSLTITGSKLLGLLVPAAPGDEEPFAFDPLTSQTMTEGQFTFSVKELEKTVATGHNDTNGNIIFDPIEYGLADVGMTYTYVISEDDSSPGWMAFTEPVTIKVEVTDPYKNGILTVTVSVYDEETEDFILIETDEDTDTQFVEYAIDVENHRIYDAALRKWVSDVNPVNVANIDTEGIGNSNSTADDGVKSDPVQVYIGDDVEYTIRVFNQCEWPLKVTGVIDNVPDGLFFDINNPLNEGWTQEGADGPITYIFDEALILYPEGSADGLSTAEVTVVLKVMPNIPAGEPVTNSAMIIGITDEDDTPVIDIDSDFDPEELDEWYDTDSDNEIDQDGKRDKNGRRAGDRDEHDIAQIYVEGTINVEVYKDTIKLTSAAFDGAEANVATEASGIIDNVQKQESYRYDINFRSTSNVDVDEFVVEDPLEAVNDGLIRIVDFWTPAVWGDKDGSYKVYYRTNNSGSPATDGLFYPTDTSVWTLWATVTDPGWGSTGVIGRQKLTMPALGEDEYITGLRFDFGAVKVGFTSRVDNARMINISGVEGIRNTNGSDGYDNLIDEPIGGLESPETPDGVPTKGIENDWSPTKNYIFYPKNSADEKQLLAAKAGGLLKPATYLVVATMSSEEMMDPKNGLDLASLTDGNGDIVVVSSAIAYIAKHPVTEPTDTGGGSGDSGDSGENTTVEPIMFATFAGGILDANLGFVKTAGETEGGVLFDNDQDRVLTRFIIPFMYKQDLGEGQLEYTDFEDSNISFAGMHMVDGVWYDNDGRRVQTGDMFAISLWMVLLACAAICFVLLIRTFIVGAGRKKRQENEIVSGTEKGGGM